MLLLRLYDYVSLLTTDDSLHQWLASQFVGHRTPIKKKENWPSFVRNHMKDSFKIVDDSGWTEEISGSQVISSTNIQNIGKVFKYESILNCNVEKVRDRLFNNIEKSPEWNTNLQDVKMIQKIDDKTCITHVTTKPCYMISSRDFVHLRLCGQTGDCYVLTCVSIVHPKVPEISNIVRGEHRICTYIMSPLKNDPSKTHFIWLMNIDLKGWLPRRLIDQTLSSVMMDHVKDIQKCFNN